MKRYQVYLNPQSVDVVDTFAKKASLDRSHVIRTAVDALAENLGKLLVKRNVATKGALDDLIGIIKFKGKKKTRIAENIDEIYLKD